MAISVDLLERDLIELFRKHVQSQEDFSVFSDKINVMSATLFERSASVDAARVKSYTINNLQDLHKVLFFEERHHSLRSQQP